jgi:hypothetical protein
VQSSTACGFASHAGSHRPEFLANAPHQLSGHNYAQSTHNAPDVIAACKPLVFVTIETLRVTSWSLREVHVSQTLSYGLMGRGYQYYQHSGKVTAHGILLAAAIGLPAAVLMGIAYAYADLYSPIVYLNILLAIGFGVGIAWVCGKILQVGKVRNVPVSLAIIGVITAVAYYVCWVVWVFGTFDRFVGVDDPAGSTLKLATNPGALWDAINFINSVGTWTIGRASSSSGSRANVSGTALWIVWIGEALLIFGAAFALGRKLAGDKPFCEKCDRWCEPARTVASVAAGDPARLRSEIEGGQYAYLQELRNHEIGGHWWQVDQNWCGGCNGFHTITVQEITRSVDKKGNEQRQKRKIIDRLIVTPAQVEQIRASLTPPAAPAAPSA